MLDRLELNKLYDMQEFILTDWSEIEEGIDSFYSELSIRISFKKTPREIPIRIPIRLSFAKAILDNTRTLLIDKLNPIENEYIKLQMPFYNKMIENIGRIDWELKDAAKDMLQKTEDMNVFASKTIPIKSAQFISLLHRSHTVLIVNPMINAAKRLRLHKLKNRKDDIKIIIDESLFLYWVFLELYQSSESIGTITAQYPPGIARGRSSTNLPEQVLPASLPEVPENVKMIPELTESEEEIDIFSEGGSDDFVA